MILGNLFPDKCKNEMEGRDGRDGIRCEKKELECIMYMYKLHTRNVNIMFCKHVYIHNKEGGSRGMRGGRRVRRKRE